jgi:hypothetical protein
MLVTSFLVQLQMASYLAKARPKEIYAQLKRTIMYVANEYSKETGPLCVPFSLRVLTIRLEHVESNALNRSKIGPAQWPANLLAMAVQRRVRHASSTFSVSFEHSLKSKRI